MAGGFCRTSDRADVRAISMGEGARTADVWVISEKPVERMTLLASQEDVKVRRIVGRLPSRAADNLFWLGRYLERAEATLRLIRSLCTSLMDSEAAIHGAGETLVGLQKLLIAWGALDEEALGARALVAARDALLDPKAYGSVVYLVRASRRTASSLRERLSADFWALLLNLESRLLEGERDLLSEAEAFQQVESALQILAALAGLSQENMNRGAGWRFLDMGRRVERGINACRYARAFAHDAATIDDLDLLLDLADSQITYRARYLVGLALTPVRDMVMLDPFNTRSLAFQVVTLKEHLSALPSLLEDGMLEEPNRLLLTLAVQVETEDAGHLDADKMIYDLRHRTTYSYKASVTFARCVLRLTPQSSASQTVLENLVTVVPAPAQSLQRTGPFGEQTLTVVVDTPHSELIIEARSRVDVHPPPPMPLADSPRWEAVRAHSFDAAGLEPDDPATFVYPTHRTPLVPVITDYARSSFTAGRPIAEAADDLMTRIHADFTYDSEATTVSTQPLEAFEARRGVCQDFAHVMISGLRGLGLPAAYVSGYLRTRPPPGKPRLAGADATHAWVSVWCGADAGWVGFDPTNALIVQDQHIVLAVGRDYSDVAPIDGVILAAGEQTLKVEVDVVPEDEFGALMPSIAARPPAGVRQL